MTNIDIRPHDKDHHVIQACLDTMDNYTNLIPFEQFDTFVWNLAKQVIKAHLGNGNVMLTHTTLCYYVITKHFTKKQKYWNADLNLMLFPEIIQIALSLRKQTAHLMDDLVAKHNLRGSNVPEFKIGNMATTLVNEIYDMVEDKIKDIKVKQ